MTQNSQYSSLAAVLALILTMPLKAIDPPKPDTPHNGYFLLRYGCSLELPLPEDEIRGKWIAISYIDNHTLPHFNTSKKAKLYSVNVKTSRCGGDNQGTAFPDSPRPLIIGASPKNIKWLIRGLKSQNIKSKLVECSHWDLPQVKAPSVNPPWTGTFLKTHYSISFKSAGILIFKYGDAIQEIPLNPDEGPTSFFIGDIDCDGKPDLIIESEDDKGCGTNFLFLSSTASGTALVQCVYKYTECND